MRRLLKQTIIKANVEPRTLLTIKRFIIRGFRRGAAVYWSAEAGKWVGNLEKASAYSSKSLADGIAAIRISRQKEYAPCMVTGSIAVIPTHNPKVCMKAAMSFGAREAQKGVVLAFECAKVLPNQLGPQAL